MQLIIPASPDFSFFETVSSHGWLRLLPFTWHDQAPDGWTDWRPPPPDANGSSGALERIEQLHDGTVVRIRISEVPGGLAIDAEGAQEVHKGEIVRKVRRMLQLDIDIGPFRQFAADRPALANVATRNLGRVLRSPTLFEDVANIAMGVST